MLSSALMVLSSLVVVPLIYNAIRRAIKAKSRR